MARFDVSGMDDIIKQMAALGKLVGETADEMLMAGAEVVKEAWRDSAEEHDHRVTGDMIDSIGYPRHPDTINGIRTIDIYPQGKDSKGVRNAEKAFILHYGTKKSKGSHWVDGADRISGERVTPAMEQIWHKKLEQKGLI